MAKKNHVLKLMALSLFCSINPMQSKIQGHFYVHGIAATKNQAFEYTPFNINGQPNKNHLLPQNVHTFNMPDATNKFWRVNFTKTGLAQANEIAAIYNAYQKTLFDLKIGHNQVEMLDFGLSRGASGLACFAGLFELPETKCIILESPFGSMDKVVAHILKKIGLQDKSWAIDIAHSLASKIFMQYKKDGIRPIDMVGSIRSDMFILLVCSKEDDTVPHESTVDLYKKLKVTNHPNTYILILNKGEHAKILSGPEGDTYLQVANAFMKKCGFKHNPTLAELGQARLALCQPEPETL